MVSLGEKGKCAVRLLLKVRAVAKTPQVLLLQNLQATAEPPVPQHASLKKSLQPLRKPQPPQLNLASTATFSSKNSHFPQSTAVICIDYAG
jgi:hypothetical protein